MVKCETQYKHGLSIVNGGKVVDYLDSFVEVLGLKYSKHIKNMVVAYAMEGNIKVSVVYDGEKFYVYRFKGALENHHYWSKAMDRHSVLNSSKYGKMGRFCMQAYSDIFKL